MKNTIKLLKSLQIVLLVMLTVCTSAVVFDVITSGKEKAQIEQIAQMAHKHYEDSNDNQEKYFINNLKEIKEQNNDFYGWLEIEAAEVDLPVMLNNGRKQYYLHRAFDKAYSYRGNLFVDDYCDPDSDFIIIHGHSMKDGTMFGQLHKLSNQNIYDNNKIFTFYAKETKYTYEIVSAFHTKILFDEEEGFRYYEYEGFTNKEEFDEFIYNSILLSEIKTDLTCEYGDKILVLSTCSIVFDRGRFVVVAKQIA